MKYTAFISIEFEDKNDDRAEGRAKEMATWAAEGLEGAYGDGDPTVTHTHIEQTHSTISGSYEEQAPMAESAP